MLAALEQYYQNRIAKVEEEEINAVEKAKILRPLSQTFKEDIFGRKAGKHLQALTSSAAFSQEKLAYETLLRARADFRELPPAGRYAYNMSYRLSQNQKLIRQRNLMISDFHLTLKYILDQYPETQAALSAENLLYDYPMPELDKEAAKAQLEQAELRLKSTNKPVIRYEAYLPLYGVIEGYMEVDALNKKAVNSLEELKKGSLLQEAGKQYHSLKDDTYRVMQEIRHGGSMLEREKAEKKISELKNAAEKAGSDSRLAANINNFVDKLLKSYDGPACLGAVFDRKYQGAGVRVQFVYPQTSARTYGLQPGDVILELDGQAVSRRNQLESCFRKYKPGRTVKIKARRDGQKEPFFIKDFVLGRKT